MISPINIKTSMSKLDQITVTEQQKTKKKMRYITKFEQKKYLKSHIQAEARLLAKVKLNMLKEKEKY